MKTLFQDVAAYILELKSPSAREGGPTIKKRKLNDEAQANSKASSDEAILNAPWSSKSFEGVSLSVPQRKKLSLEISSKRAEGIRAVNPSTKGTEFGIPWKEIGSTQGQSHASDMCAYRHYRPCRLPPSPRQSTACMELLPFS